MTVNFRKYLSGTRTRFAGIGCLAILGVLIASPYVVKAFSLEQLADETYNDFVVGPGKVEMTLKPGESKTVDLKITNRMGNPRTFNLETEDFTGSTDPEQAVVLLGSERGPYTLRDYIIPEFTTFDLNNGQRATLRVTVSVPADAEPGGRYGSLLISTDNPPSGNLGDITSGAAIVSRIGVLFFITIPGDVDHEGKMVKFDTTSGTHWFFDNTGSVGMSILYENKGSVHVNPYGIISITNISGETVGEIKIDPWFAMPDSLRRRDLTWQRDFLFGRYTATAQINRGYDNVIDTQTVTFWVIPWKIVAAVFAALVVVIGIIRFLGSRVEIKVKKKK